ncbi:MAG: hypothetical protein ACRDS0_26015 [Pseudonocardiaceae bacterium]
MAVEDIVAEGAQTGLGRESEMTLPVGASDVQTEKIFVAAQC